MQGIDRSRFARRGLHSLFFIVALLCLLAAPASATVTHEPEPFSPIDGSGSGVTLHDLDGIAGDETTGNIFVSDAGSEGEGNGLFVLGGAGGAPTGLVSPYDVPGLSFKGNTRVGLAYDNGATSPAKGSLYAYELATETIKKFVRNGATQKYELVAEFPVPGSGGGAGHVGLGIDGAGNLYLGSESSGDVYKISPSGALLATYSLAKPIQEALGAPAPVGGPGQIAVDSAGDLFVQIIGEYHEEGGVLKFPVDAGGEIDPSVYSRVTTGVARGVAYDPTTEHVYISLVESPRIEEYDATTLAEVSEFGQDTFTGGIARLYVDAATHRIYVVDTEAKTVDVFGGPVTVPTTIATPPSNVTGTKATLNGTIDPEGIPVTSCKFEWGPDSGGQPVYSHSINCESLPPTDSQTHSVSAQLSTLEANGVGYHYRLVAENENGVSRSAGQPVTTIHTTVTEPATEVEPTAVTLNGLVRPEGEAYTACKFEWGLTTAAGYEHQAQCSPEAADIPVDFEPHQVSAQLTGLVANTTYKYRLSTVGGEALSGEELTVETTGRPVVSEVRAREGSQSSALIEAEIDPRSFDTSYLFEWGPTTAYGNSVPISPKDIGTSPTRVSANLAGLALGTTYHYRVVASSEAGTTDTTDQTFETLNSCGLPEGRCIELVSPSPTELGPAGAPGRYFGSYELHWQAAPIGSGALAYTIEGGIPGVTRGGNTLYRAVRSANRWSSTQLSPAITTQGEKVLANSNSSTIFGLSPDLGCGVLATNQPLKPNTAASQLILEHGGGNLYRINSDGSVTLLTDLAPQNPAAAAAPFEGEYTLIGMASDCHKIVFASRYTYPGIHGVGKRRLYEWEGGELRNLGVVPGSSGSEVPAEAAGGGENFAGGEVNRLNAVSSDGSRVFFSAPRVVPGHAGDLGEVGSIGLFARDNGTTTIDVSASETGVPDLGATFQGATADGGHVFFTANAGLTSPSNPTGTDLYEYTFNPPGGEPHLVDLSVSVTGEKAEVAGMAGFSTDGSTVYYAAQGKLVPGKAATLGANQAAGTYSLYASRAGVLTYIGPVAQGDINSGVVLTQKGNGQAAQSQWSARVSADGRYLLFRSLGSVTGFESNGRPEVYLYDADDGAEPTTCLSCRTDGHGSFDPAGLEMLASGTSSNPLYAPASLTVRNGQPIAVFRSLNALAPGAREGEGNLYEWSHGQVFLLASEPVGAASSATQLEVKFVGASENGGDLYVIDAAALNWENPESRYAVWDARVGGGFAQPGGPAPACDPRAEGACQGSSAGAASMPSPATSAGGGEGNIKPKPHKRHKKHKKKGHHKKHKKKGKKDKQQGKGKLRKQPAKADRGAGK